MSPLRNRKARYLLLTSACFYIIAAANEKVAMFLLCWLIVSLLLVSWSVVLIGASGVRLVRDALPPRVLAGERLPIRLRIVNGGALPKFNLLIEDRLVNETLGTSSTHTSLAEALPAHGSVVAESLAPVTGRGRLRLGPAMLIVADPLGLFERRSPVLDTGAEVLVRPRLVALPRWRPVGAGRGQGAQRLRTSSGFDFRGLRDYQSGDDLRFVHWRSTARTGRLQIREFEVLEAAEATVLLDLHRDQISGPPGASSLEAAVVAAGSILLRLRELGVRARLVADEEGPLAADVLPDGPAPDELLDLLATVRGSGGRTALEVLCSDAGRARPGDLIVVVSADDGDALLEHLAALAERGHEVILVRLDGPAFAGQPAADGGGSLGGVTCYHLGPGVPLEALLGEAEAA